MLKGYKTYITAGVAVISAVAAYLVGDVNLADTAQIVLTSILGVTIRSGIKNDVKK
jgi:hypothetical protein